MKTIIAHRGASKEAPENTLSSVRAALALGADYVEVDVRLTKDNVPVVIHDSDLIRTARISHLDPIHHLSLEELKSAEVGSWFDPIYTGERIPTLEEILQEDWGHSGLMLEIKYSPYSSRLLVPSILSVLANAKQLPSRISIGSFSLKLVQQIQNEIRRLPQGSKVIGIVEDKRKLQPFLECSVDQVALKHRLISADLMQELAKHGLDVWAFTVDNPHLAQQLITMGVSGIISNCPRTMHQLGWPSIPPIIAKNLFDPCHQK